MLSPTFIRSWPMLMRMSISFAPKDSIRVALPGGSFSQPQPQHRCIGQWDVIAERM
jgi:hypothetical protein